MKENGKKNEKKEAELIFKKRERNRITRMKGDHFSKYHIPPFPTKKKNKKT